MFTIAITGGCAPPSAALPGRDAGGTTPYHEVDGALDPAPAPVPGEIAIYLTGDLSPRDYHDGLAGQTPETFKVAVSAYYLQTSLQDPHPVLCFQHQEPAVADLHRDNLIGACQISAVPSAVYTHGRVKVDWLQIKVQGTVHSLGVPYPGAVTFFRAYSATHHDGKAYRASEGSIEFSGLSGVELPVTYAHLPELPGITLETIDGEFWMTFPFSRPLPIDQQNEMAHWARFSWEIHDAWRWHDRMAWGHEGQVWDVGVLAGATEEVLFTGASGYHVTSSVD